MTKIAKTTPNPPGVKSARASESGLSILLVLVALGLAGVLAMVMTQITSNSIQRANSTTIREEVEMLKETVRSRFDCRKSLNLTATTPLPLSCASYTTANFGSEWKLRSRAGTTLGSATNKIGDWTLSATCDSNRIVISATSPGIDPLTRKSRNDIKTNKTGTSISTDLFGGTTKYCQELFSPGSSCTGTYNLFQGSTASGPKCCRRIQHIATNKNRVSVATCSATEYVATGGGSCHSAHTGSSTSATTRQPVLHTTYHDTGSNHWRIDCQADAGGGAGTGVEMDSIAFALCCPR